MAFSNVAAWDRVSLVGVDSVSMSISIMGASGRQRSSIARVVVSNNGGLGLVYVSVMLVHIGGLVVSMLLLRVVGLWVVGVSTDLQSKDGSSGGCGFREHYRSILFLLFL